MVFIFFFAGQFSFIHSLYRPIANIHPIFLGVDLFHLKNA